VALSFTSFLGSYSKTKNNNPDRHGSERTLLTIFPMIRKKSANSGGGMILKYNAVINCS